VIFKGPFAKIIDYEDYKDSFLISCPVCKWQGKAKKGDKEYYSDLFDISCPKCFQMILIVSYPIVKKADIGKAIAFATEVHKGQTRKGKSTPYITHPKAVGQILASVTKDEEIIEAGILHDTIEDCQPYGSITKETIEWKFGPRVARMVNDVTEQDKSLHWSERKQQALEHIVEMDNGSLLVKSADVLHNLKDQIADYRKEGDAMFAKFNAGKADQLKRYEKLITAISKKWPQNPLLDRLAVNLDEIKRLWV